MSLKFHQRSPLIEGIHQPKTQGSVDVWHCIVSSRDNDQNDTYGLPHNYMAQLADALFSSSFSPRSGTRSLCGDEYETL
jgi:hypothetical protein